MALKEPRPLSSKLESGHDLGQVLGVLIDRVVPGPVPATKGFAEFKKTTNHPEFLGLS